MVPGLSSDTNTKGAFWKGLVQSSQVIRFSVPQGSILGPLLFVLYINDLPQWLKNCFINKYADDTVLYSTGPCTLEINKLVQDDLNRVAQLMETYRLIFNQSKTKSVLFGGGQNLAKSPNFQLHGIQLHGKVLKRKPTLAIWVLYWTKHFLGSSMSVARSVGF